MFETGARLEFDVGMVNCYRIPVKPKGTTVDRAPRLTLV